MISYLFLLFVTVGITYLGRRFGSYGVTRLTLVMAAGFLVLFAGLRDRSVGTDTGNYVGWLNLVNSFEDALTFPVELGYSLLVLLSGWLSEGYAVLLVVTAAVTVSFYLVTIARLTHRYEIAIFAYIAFGFYTFCFNGARQGIAAAICFFALPWLLERRFFPYLMLIILAFFFHKTALIAIPLYFVAGSRVSWRELLVVAVAAVSMAALVPAFANFFASFIDEKYAAYGQAGDGGGEVQAAFLVGQGVILLFLKRQINDPEKYYARLLNIYLIGLVPVLASVAASVNPSGILRLSFYFSHVAILLWPMAILSFRNSQSRAIFSAGFILVSIIYFILATSSFSNLTPYSVNSELFQ